ncbi:cellulose synthase/poly-beta-1,6-N-acetylglucosamine synthase-like glycosyltransferase [Glaciihabitans tibetensis]|uniref:Cellulose synthase/poly-beta-1,6-N-acetylglucosamine synthase-like glycosyltransferase n=1 Tax=Glaciihabitans tibetensis TaxID=1266600 RepID=A0A2T0VGX4_9MICO|nr:glycosyltransferase family 2 protein [Glaciihabitans tibetensis]PRY69464.1 cellulose synthase/poly-beta-1,6-N-acetylglucosamine synthase-like glycosyltransferase [Glaciihabitans tibetensis]
MAPQDDSYPGVSYVMPVLNEVDYVAGAVSAILRQEYPGAQQLILALGPSTDGTTELVEQLLRDDPRVTFVYNPETHIPVGMNLAVRASEHPIIVRVDAHSELSAGYTLRAVQTLQRTGAANVGGLMNGQGRTPFQSAVARAYNSKFGLGGGAYHSGRAEGPAESAYLGVFRREVLLDVGLYDESLRRGEDWELNLRIRAAGHRVWFDPELTVTYWPRENWRKLARQFFTTGVWRAELVRRYRTKNPWRFFAPPLLVLAVPVAVIVLALQLTGVLSGLLGVIASLVYLAPVAYLLLVVWVSFVREPGETVRDRLIFLIVLPTMHLSWGAGFLRGILRGGRDTLDTSRSAG